jgi:NADH-quinone oxidoreductase subunit D
MSTETTLTSAEKAGTGAGGNRRIVLGVQDSDDMDLPTDPLPLNMGPSHPAMHGTVRMVLDVEGEKITNVDLQIGYLHRCFEKEAEYATYTQIFPYTDRLNYVSPMLNNIGYAMAVEKLLGLDGKIPERALYIRVIVGEISRITDHMTCLGAGAMELGAFTVFLYMLKAREWLYEVLEEVSGARLTHSYMRIGGVSADLPDGFAAKVLDIIKRSRGVIDECGKLLNKNRIFRDRMDGIAVITKEEAIAWGITGPVGRSTGFDYDVRKDHPYLVYDRFNFDVAVGSVGDNFDRYMCRVEEMQQSMRILEQAFEQIPDGPVIVNDPRVRLPAKAETYNSIEAMIAHFKVIMDGIHVPPGEVYSFTEAGNGELGFYIVADGTGRPWKCRVRPPCFANVSILPKILPGLFIADIVPTFGMINMIGGECDR